MKKETWIKLGIFFASLLAVINLSVAIVLFKLMKQVEASSIQSYAFSDYLSVYANQMGLLNTHLIILSLFIAGGSFFGFYVIKKGAEIIAKTAAEKMAQETAEKIAEKVAKEKVDEIMKKDLEDKEQKAKDKNSVIDLFGHFPVMPNTLNIISSDLREWDKK